MKPAQNLGYTGVTHHIQSEFMLIKTLIVLVLLAILFSLFSGMIFLVKDKGQSQRTVKALTVRIALSVALFILLMVAFATGLIQPHGVNPG